MADEGTSIVGGVGVFFGSLGLFLANEFSAFTSVVASLPFAILTFFFSMTVAPRLQEARQRRARHKETIVARGVVGALEKTRPELERDLLMELRWNLHNGWAPVSSKPSPLHWEWLIEHDRRVAKASTRLASATAVFEEALNRFARTIETELLDDGWRVSRDDEELADGEIRASTFALHLLEAGAPPRPNFRYFEQHSSDETLFRVSSHAMARADKVRLTRLRDWIHQNEGRFIECAAGLSEPYERMRLARQHLVNLLEAIEAEGSVAGSCSACRPRFLRYG